GGNGETQEPPPVVTPDPKAKLGESCAELECEDKLFCEGKICVTHVGVGKKCVKSHSCNKGLECSDASICKNPVSGEGNTCEDDSSCKEGLKCLESVCRTPATVGESCEDAVCIEGKCINTICTIEMDIDEDCTAEKGHVCKAGLLCDEDLLECYKPLELGENCSGTATYCEAGLICHAEKDICMNDGLLGDTCDEDAYLSCNPDDGLVCIDGKCREPVVKDCDELHPCLEKDAVCYDGKCIVSHGCEGDHECLADTYCCTEEACQVKGVCLPYGEGPRKEVNEECHYETVQGLFEADVQCEWTHTDDPNQYKEHKNVLMTPIVMNTPHDSKLANEIIFTTYNCTDGGAPSSSGSDINCYGVIRIINAENCTLLESIFDNANRVIGGSNLAMADLDGDGKVEIVAGRGTAQPSGAAPAGGLVVFHWSEEQGRYVTKCQTTNHHQTGTTYWGGPAIHDINNDGKPELIGYGGEAFDANCNRLNPGQTIGELSYTATLADLDNNGNVEIIGTSSIYRWNTEASKWEVAYSGVRSTGIHPAFADFGTPKEDGSFDFEHLDGIAETVGCGSGIVELSTLSGKKLMRITGMSGGGPCTIGDFDGDTFPEIATAFGDKYRIFDPQCTKDSNGALPKGCLRDYVLWETVSQDASSSSTGSSLFDFDGDGTMEALYADECFTRVYEGPTGKVLFSSHHTSCTWHEYPIIADVDNDESAEIIVGSNNNCGTTCKNGTTTTGPDGKKYVIDPIHRGLYCKKDADCYSGVCKNELCRCTDYQQCNAKSGANAIYENGCVDAMTAAEQADGKVCRAIHPQADFVTGVRVLRDRLDRWTSSRNLWNQHAYSITNINDDQTIPQTSKWLQNFKQNGLNNFRQNVQGVRGKNAAPDITCKLNKDNLCVHSSESNEITLTGVVCNRGTKMVASQMPASFYDVTDGNLGTKYCTAYTATNVPIGGCLAVSCTLNDTEITGKRIRMIANDDGEGGKTTVECNEDNNTDEVLLESCGVN
ncbi:MAG: VCBS repeat-containing protein, partial [Proteobacteria bacterium]|nr:VCBS repeat-containing protein [Pseudomonadota bacterium]